MANNYELTITRQFKAPPAKLFSLWTTADHLDHWFRPADFTNVETRVAFEVGGEWYAHIRDVKTGSDHIMAGIYQEIEAGKRIVFTHAWRDEAGQPKIEHIITVTFEPVENGQTQLTFHQAGLESEAAAASHREGWEECLNNLDDFSQAIGLAA